jgi:O-antigen ligase
MNKAAFIIYLICLNLSPLLFGSVHTYAYTLVSLGVLSATLLLMTKNIRKNPKSHAYQFQCPITSLNFLFVSLLIFLMFQIIPLPDFIVEFLSPQAKIVGEKSLPASIAVIQDSQGKDGLALSPYYYPVRMSIMRFAIYGLFFLSLTQLLNSQKRIELAVFLILITGSFEAMYGLIQTYSGSGYIWWYKKGTNLRDLTGTYINRNHFAGFMGMGLLLAASYAAAIAPRGKEDKTVYTYGGSVRRKVSRFISGEHRFNKRSLILFAGVVMGIGLIFSASRGGMISAAGGMLCMGLLFISRKDHRRKGLVLVILFVITSVYAVHIGVEYPLERFKTFYASLEQRARYTEKTIDMFQDYKLSGIGVGNFQYAYPKYQAAEDKGTFIRHAHNDWAQYLAEAGIIGLCILLAGVSYFIYWTMRLWRKRRDPFAVCLGVAPLAAMATIAIHSYTDFNLHIPANFLMLVAIMAIGYSAIHLERHRGGDKTLYRYYMLPLRYRGALVLLLTLGVIFWTGFWAVRHFVAEAYCNTVTNSTLNRDQFPSLEEIRKAISWDPWNADYRYKLAHELMKIRNETLRDQDPESRIQDQLEIVRALEEAVQLNPFRAEYHARLGWQYAYLWQDSDDRKKWLAAADLSMERAAYFAGEKNPGLHVLMGNYWVVRSKTILPSEPAWDAVWAKADWHYKKAISLEERKNLSGEIDRFIRKFYPAARWPAIPIFSNEGYDLK